MEFPSERTGMGKDFLKMKPGQDNAVRGVLRGGKPYEFKQHWESGKAALCPGEACPKCAIGKKPAFRFRVNIIVKENGAYVAKILEQGWTVYEMLRDLSADYDLEHHLIKITRSGTTKDDTSYSIIPVPNGRLGKEQEDEISMVQLLELQTKEKPPMDESPEHTDDDLPF